MLYGSVITKNKNNEHKQIFTIIFKQYIIIIKGNAESNFKQGQEIHQTAE